VVRGALFTAVVAEVISCGSTRRRAIRRAACCGVYPAEEARLNDAMSHAGVVWRAARASDMASSVVDAAVGGWQKARVLIEGVP
jgi:predicted urease superfamily metal-dependent hydrolase